MANNPALITALNVLKKQLKDAQLHTEMGRTKEAVNTLRIEQARVRGIIEHIEQGKW